MDEKELQAHTFIAKAVASMWRDFTGSHEKLVGESVNEVKGTMSLTEQDVELLRQKAIARLTLIVDDMSQYFSDYRKLVTSHLGAIMKDELRKLLDTRMAQLGFDADEKKTELLEP